MRIIIQDREEHDANRDALIRKKVRGLSQYMLGLKDAVVEVLHDRHHRKGNIASVEIALHLFCHGNLPLRAQESAGDIHEALDRCCEKLKRQLVVHKEKERAVSRSAVRTARGK